MYVLYLSYIYHKPVKIASARADLHRPPLLGQPIPAEQRPQAVAAKKLFHCWIRMGFELLNHAKSLLITMYHLTTR